MNAPTAAPPLPMARARRLFTPRGVAREMAIELWREGRSIAGIIMECAERAGWTWEPDKLLRVIQNARLRDPSIPPAHYQKREAVGLDIMDQRAAMLPPVFPVLIREQRSPLDYREAEE